MRAVLTPSQQVEARAASERRAIDVAGDAFPQQTCQQMLNGVQATCRNRCDVRLHQTNVIIRDLVSVWPLLHIDEAHIRCLDFGMVQLKALNDCGHCLSFHCDCCFPLFYQYFPAFTSSPHSREDIQTRWHKKRGLLTRKPPNQRSQNDLPAFLHGGGTARQTSWRDRKSPCQNTHIRCDYQQSANGRTTHGTETEWQMQSY